MTIVQLADLSENIVKIESWLSTPFIIIHNPSVLYWLTMGNMHTDA